MKKILPCLLLFFMLFFNVNFAYAVKNISIENDSYSDLYFVFRYQDFREGDDGGVWVTEGWFKVDAMSTKVRKLYTDNATFYLYAVQEDLRGYFGGNSNDTRDRSYSIVYNESMYLQGNAKPNAGKYYTPRFKRYYFPEDNRKLKFTYDMFTEFKKK